jgi:hypothetical protein
VILVDTSVWIDHLRIGDRSLFNLLNENQVVTHPFVIGELALGTLPQRRVILNTLQRMRRAIVASEHEVLHFIEEHRISGKGIGYVDVHLLASTKLTIDTKLWARDKHLRDIAEQLGLAPSERP